MKFKRFNKIMGVILAIALPITIIGTIAIIAMTPKQNFYQEAYNDNTWMGGMMSNMMNGGHMFSSGHRNRTDSCYNNNNNNNNSNNNNSHMNGNNHMNGSNNNNNSNNNSNSLDNGMQKFDNVNSINVKYIVDDLVIEASPDNAVYLEYTGTRSLNFTERNGKLSVQDAEGKSISWNLKQPLDNRGTLKILVPANFNEVDVEAKYSNLSVDGIEVYELEIDTGIGYAKIENTKAKQLELEIGVGNVDLNNITANKADIEGGIGNINITKSKIDTLKTDHGIGAINLEDNTIGNHIKN